MLALSQNLLGIGLYTPQEAALYARVPVQTVNRWMYGNRKGNRVIRPQLDGTDEPFVTFLDFVQMLRIRSIRMTRKVPMHKIREAISFCEDRYGLRYPFAMSKTLYLFDDYIVLCEPGSTKKDAIREFVQVTGESPGQRIFTPIVDAFGEELSFGDDQIATKYSCPLGRHRAIMDPQVRFGEPMIDDCGYTARILWEAAVSEGSPEDAARVYDVDPSVVYAACEYHQLLLARTPMISA